MWLYYGVGRVKEDPTSWALVLGKDTEKNLRSYPWQNRFIEGRTKRTERAPQRRGRPSQERHWHRDDEVGGKGVLNTGLLHIHIGGCELTDLIDSCKLHNNRLQCACLSHNVVCYNQMYVCIEYL